MTISITFRGKRVDNGEWVYGYYFESFTGIPYIMVLHDHILGMTEFYEVDPSTVGQYTGLKDKNGKEIYEGGVVRCRAGEEYHGVSEFDRIIVAKLGCAPGMCDMIHCDSIKVIGNIHDNPELLKGVIPCQNI